MMESKQPTVCVTCVWAGVDSVWEQGKLEARKMLENAAESHTSGARFVGRIVLEDSITDSHLLWLHRMRHRSNKK